MDLNHLLSWTVGAGCVVILLQFAGQKHAPVQRQLVKLAAGILAVLTIGQWLFPEQAGYVAGILFALLILLPNWGTMFLNQLLIRKRHRLAWWIAQGLWLLRPGKENYQLPTLIRAMSLIQAGAPDSQVTALLEKLLASESPTGCVARVLLTRQQGSWQDYLDWAELPENRDRVLADPNLLDTWLQSFGETGQREELLRQLDQLPKRNFPMGDVDLMRMKAAAFWGDDFIVAQFLSGSLRDLPDVLKQYWRATAVQTAGRVEEAARDFQQLASADDAGVALSARRRLENPLPSVTAQQLSPDVVHRLQRLSFLAEHQIQHGSVLLDQPPCWATWLLAAALVIAFLIEIPGGSENPMNLIRLGAMLIPPDPSGQGWWRMFTAAFLHFGPLHLGMNLLGLLILGTRLERMWGPWLLLVSYLLAAFGSIGITAMVVDGTNMLVGASGGVMGLLGGLLAQSLFDLMRHRREHLVRQFATLLMIVLIQMSFDASTPEVSSEAHLLGVTIGFLCGTLWNAIWWFRFRMTY